MMNCVPTLNKKISRINSLFHEDINPTVFSEVVQFLSVSIAIYDKQLPTTPS